MSPGIYFLSDHQNSVGTCCMQCIARQGPAPWLWPTRVAVLRCAAFGRPGVSGAFPCATETRLTRRHVTSCCAQSPVADKRQRVRQPNARRSQTGRSWHSVRGRSPPCGIGGGTTQQSTTLCTFCTTQRPGAKGHGGHPGCQAM